MSIVKIGHFEVNLGRKLGEGGFGAGVSRKGYFTGPAGRVRGEAG